MAGHAPLVETVTERVSRPYRTDYIRRELSGRITLNLVALLQWAQGLGIDLAELKFDEFGVSECIIVVVVRSAVNRFET